MYTPSQQLHAFQPPCSPIISPMMLTYTQAVDLYSKQSAAAMSVGGAMVPPQTWSGKTAAETTSRTVLTNPSKPCHNNNCDNENWDLIIHVGDEFLASSGMRYGVLIVVVGDDMWDHGWARSLHPTILRVSSPGIKWWGCWDRGPLGRWLNAGRIVCNDTLQSRCGGA